MSGFPRLSVNCRGCMPLLDETREHLERAHNEMLRARAHSRQLTEANQKLLAQHDRFEAHPLLGPLLRSRRRLKELLHSPSAKMVGR